MAGLRKHKYIILILAVAFTLRLAALDYGLPHLLSFGDEIVHVAAGFNLLAQKTLRANFDFYYLPPLLAYLLAPIFGLIGVLGILLGKFQGLVSYQNFVLLHKEYFLEVSRIISALFGTGAVYIIYLLAKKLFQNEKAAYLAAIFLAFDFFSVHESQIGRIWMPLTFFILASAYFICRLYQEGKAKWYWLSALMIGLGFGMGYAAIMMIFWFLLAHLMRKEKFFSKKFILSGSLIVFFIGIFIYLNSVSLRLFTHIIFTIGTFFGRELVFSPIDIPANVQSNYFYFKEMVSFLWYNSPLFFIFGLLGFLMIIFSKREWFFKFLLTGVPLIYLVIITFLFTGIEDRYVLPAVPFFILAASYLAVHLTERFFRNKLFSNFPLFFLVLIIIGGYSFYISILYTLKLQKPDTRIQAVGWINQNIESESSIIMGDKFIELNENKKSILFLKASNPSRMDAKRKYLLGLEEKDYPKPKYNVFHLGRLDRAKLDFSQIKADYLVVSFWNNQGKKAVDFFPYQKKLMARFYPSEEVKDLSNLLNEPAETPLAVLRSIKYLGPYVEIYKVQ